jgi:REP element-mobilizing transposase RayT
MRLQIPRSVCAQALEENAVWQARAFLGSVFHALARQRRSQILESNMLQDHVHMLIRIPPPRSYQAAAITRL